MATKKDHHKRLQKTHATRSETLKKRRQWVQKKFRELYEVKRIRYDDCIKIIARQLFLSEATIERDLTSPSD